MLGGLVSLSWWAALTAFYWAGLIRVGLLHHITWSINSICHMIGERPFIGQGKATNFWPLAILSMGESWHNLHHADPTCARHERGQIEISARTIRGLERLGWATDVRWPTTVRLARLRSSAPWAAQGSAIRGSDARGTEAHPAVTPGQLVKIARPLPSSTSSQLG
jgi:stearoyl-CoA desaturase (delta-9 desaturase)